MPAKPAPLSPYTTSSARNTNPFISFGTTTGAGINVRDRKHMSIIDDPACLSPGGNTARNHHNSTYRLSDILSSYDPGSGESKRGSVVREGGLGSEKAGEGDVGSSDRSDEESGSQSGGKNGQEDPFRDDGSSVGQTSDDEDASEVETGGEKNSASPGSESRSGSGSSQASLKSRRTGKSSLNPSIASSAKQSTKFGHGKGSESRFVPDQSSIVQSRAETRDFENSGDSSRGSEDVESESEQGHTNRNDRRHSIMTDFSNITNDRPPPKDMSCFSPLPLNQENLAVGMSWLWQTSAFSDLLISCGHYNFPVHKCILAAQCRDFGKLIRQTSLSPSFAGKAVLELHDDHPEALKAMLQYLYTGHLAVPTASITILGGPEVPSVDMLLKVYELGCKYQLPRLKAEAAKQYKSVLSTSWSKGHALFLAKLVVKIFKMVEKAEGREEWFVGGARELKEVTLGVAVECAEELVGDPVAFDLLEGEPMRALVKGVMKGFRRVTSSRDEKIGMRSPDDASAVPLTPMSVCSAEGFWR